MLKNLFEKYFKIENLFEKYFQIDFSYVFVNGFWYVVGRIFVFLIAFISFYFLTNLLTQTDYGTYQYILSAFSILSVFSLAGIDTSIIKSIAQGKEKTFLLAVKTKFKWSLIGGLFAFLSSLWYFLHHNFLLGFSFLLITIFLPFIPIFNLYLSYFQGKKRFDLQSQALILVNLAELLFLIPVLIFTKNLILVLIAYFLSQFLVNLIIFIYTLRQIKKSEIDDSAIEFGKHLSLMSALGILGDQIDRIVLWQFLGPVSVAIYSLAKIPYQRVCEIIPLSALALPKISEKEISQIKKKVLVLTFKLLPFFIIASLALIISAPIIYKILFPKYLSSIKYLQIFSLGLIFIPFSLLGTVFIVQERKKELYVLTFCSQIGKIILFLVLIPTFGILGAVLTELIVSFFYNLLVLFFYRKI